MYRFSCETSQSLTAHPFLADLRTIRQEMSLIFTLCDAIIVYVTSVNFPEAAKSNTEPFSRSDLIP